MEAYNLYMMVAYYIGESPQDKWSDLISSRCLVTNKLSIDTIEDCFCMGSCFARNIRKTLEKENIRCFPEYNMLNDMISQFNQDVRIDDIDKGDYHMNYYTPFAILQELTRSINYINKNALSSNSKFTHRFL